MLHFRTHSAALALAGLLIGHGALAQGTPAQGPASPAPAPQARPADPEPTGAQLPVLAVTAVEVVRSARAPALDVVIAHGVTGTGGWGGAALVPLTQGDAPDGVLDFVLVARAPGGPVTPTGLAPIQAVMPIAADHPFRAVRVRGATNAVTAAKIPGMAEAKPPHEVCGPCVGKLFLRKGAAAPAGTPAGTIVREEELPPKARVVGPADGIADVRSDPNRLTLVIGEDGRIVDAAWD